MLHKSICLPITHDRVSELASRSSKLTGVSTNDAFASQGLSFAAGGSGSRHRRMVLSSLPERA